ncbi:uncharacterized protein YbjQ (UPF0145 family) [Variovorax boronicumulans]|uniref:hypothetical protein n=1 Tax=Variovorax boronicumulans TaxID=436515 RepID=UPI00277FF228|nr:hypothetical protein [Variovorax boronicumulans]MDP9993860.1 uncharacterized protein YbjQ (UPF0145 family) [Variovorax boronicumulans]MDQ0005276.1 uncharacterized protein YbjQ (UPF0145 family) [Variovorax boronicumulans]
MNNKPVLRTDSLLDQAMASLTEMANNKRMLADAAVEEAQNLRFQESMLTMDSVREFIDRPGNILGSPATKHGEIAEVAEVGVRRSWDILFGRTPSADLHPDRIGPIDYIVDGTDVQSKFYNGVHNSLGGVAGHLDKYPNFPAGNAYYAIPKDQFELIQKVLNGENTKLNQKSVDALKRLVEEIESKTGRELNDVVRPASFDYNEVQIGKIDETLDHHQDNITEANEKEVEGIRTQHQASLQEGLKATAIAAAVGAGVSFVGTTFAKYREGKNIFKGEFTSQDWKDVGLDTAQGAVVGGVTGGALYFMTNCASMSAPMAGAVVSAVKGLAPLVKGYYAGEISMAQLVDSGCLVCSEVGMVAAASAIGQALIPVPILGALVGALAGQVLSSILSREVEGSAKAISERMKEYTATLDEIQKKALLRLMDQFARLGQLTVAAFDLDLNINILATSAKLAQIYGVDPSKLLRTTDEVDRFILD